MRPTILRVLVVAVAVLVGAGVSGCATGAARGPERGVAVTATGRVSVKPDLGIATLAYATHEVARRMTAVLARVKALGVQDADITTVAYSITPIPAPRRTDEEPTRILAYHVMNLVRVKVRAIDSLGKVLDEAVGAGANAVREVQFGLADPAAAEARARADAVRQATARAEQLATAAGMRLGRLVWLSEGPGGGPEPRPFAAQRMAVAPGPVEVGQLDVTVTVDARWRLAR
jgi:uncharacterized protein YggE